MHLIIGFISEWKWMASFKAHYGKRMRPKVELAIEDLLSHRTHFLSLLVES